MEWKLEEDVVVCEICVYEYVIKKGEMDIKSCIAKIKQHASIYGRDEKSISDRIQNVKAWLEELGIDSTIPISSLKHAASQTKKTLMTCLKNAGILRA